MDNNEIRSAVEGDILTTSTKERSDFREALDLLMNDKYRRRKTILGDNYQVVGITTLDVIGQMYDIPFLKGIVKSYAEWRTSGDNGRGRTDVVDIAKARIEQELEKNKNLADALRSK